MACLREAARHLAGSRHAVALTGAGISVESGIPDFRSENGLWSRFNPREYAEIGAFRRNPGKVWRMLAELDALCSGAEPNAGHGALAALEARGVLKAVITQNIDGLHGRAGSREVIEYHGNALVLRCDACGRKAPRGEVNLAGRPPRCPCGGPLRPDIVFFGEAIPPEARRASEDHAQQCDVMLVVGTSAAVAPASFLPVMARRAGAFVIEVNPHRTGLAERLGGIWISERAGEALPAIVALVNGQGGS